MPLKYWQRLISKIHLLSISKTLRDQWLLVYNVAYINLTIAGVNSLNRQFKPTLYTISIAFVFVDYFGLTAENFYRFRDDIWTAIQPLCIVAIIIPVI